MRLLNVFAALSGLLALTALIYAAHLAVFGHDAAIQLIWIGAFIQIGAATAGLAIANRTGRLNLIGGALIVGGAAIFSGTLYATSILHAPAHLAPVGGIALLAGWLVLAFAKPTR